MRRSALLIRHYNIRLKPSLSDGLTRCGGVQVRPVRRSAIHISPLCAGNANGGTLRGRFGRPAALSPPPGPVSLLSLVPILVWLLDATHAVVA